MTDQLRQVTAYIAYPDSANVDGKPVQFTDWYPDHIAALRLALSTIQPDSRPIRSVSLHQLVELARVGEMVYSNVVNIVFPDASRIPEWRADPLGRLISADAARHGLVRLGTPEEPYALPQGSRLVRRDDFSRITLAE